MVRKHIIGKAFITIFMPLSCETVARELGINLMLMPASVDANIGIVSVLRSCPWALTFTHEHTNEMSTSMKVVVLTFFYYNVLSERYTNEVTDICSL